MSKQIVSELSCIVGSTVSQNCMVWGKKRTHWGWVQNQSKEGRGTLRCRGESGDKDLLGEDGEH